MLASLTLQCAAVAALILFSLLQTEALLIVPPRQPLPPLPVLPVHEAVKLVPVPSAVTRGLSMPRVRPFTMPSRIPTQTPQIVDSPADILTAANAPSLQAGTGGSGTVPGLGDTLAGTTAPPPPKPVEPPQPKSPLRVSSGVMEAKILKRVIPVYPPLAKQARISGTVRLIGVIATDGRIQKLQVVSGHPLLVGAALEAVRQWVYQPTRLNGEPVEVISPIDVNFTLSQ